MPDAFLCEDCWSLTTEYSDRKRNPQKTFVNPGPETCDLCRLLSKSIIEFRDIGHRPELQGADWRLPKQKLSRYHPSRYPTCGVDVTYILPVADDTENGGRVRHRTEHVRMKAVGCAELEITTPLDQNLPWTGFANATDISNYSGSVESFLRIDEWLGECLRDHQNCKEGSAVGAGAERPKRLIDTGSLDDEPAPRLIDCPNGDAEWGKYCALSYCWGQGGEDFYMTTRESYYVRKAGITFEELPRVFQDAVVITRRVGCRYLWV